VDGTEVLQRPGQAERAAKPALGLCRIEAVRCAIRAGKVRQSPLIEQLPRDNSRPIVPVVEATGRRLPYSTTPTAAMTVNATVETTPAISRASPTMAV
jgi:hypothetical protein